MNTYKLKISYDGARFHGWQVQPGVPTIQQVLQDVLSVIVRQEARCTGAGRTDAGVHALGQVAHMRLDRPIEPARLVRSANCLLPPDIRVLSVEPVSAEFHARKSARSKMYRYHIQTSPYHHPLRRHTSLHCRYPLDRRAMDEAARQLIGTHDFTSFANSPTEGAVARGGVRSLLQCHLVSEADGFYIEVEGTGFLYKMVRNIVGTLIEVGRGRRDPHTIVSLLAQRDRTCADVAVPPHGLTLFQINY